MGEVVYTLIIICAAVVGGITGHKLKLPVGGMLGSMAAVTAVNILLQPPITFPDEYRVVLQLVFGPMLGSTITREDIFSLKKIAISAVVMIICMLTINIILGIAVYNFSSLDVATALFATAPGGLMDMAIISADFGANPAYVALMQLSRLMFIFIFMIPFYKKIMKRFSPAATPSTPASTPPPTAPSASIGLPVTPATTPPPTTPSVAAGLPPKPVTVKDQAKQYGLTLFFGSVLGITLWTLNIPAGAIIGAMLGSAMYNIFSRGKAYFPMGIRLPLRIVAGLFFGMRFDRESMLAIAEIIIPLLILMLGVVLMTVVTCFVLHKFTKLDVTTSLLSSTPGGITEMALLADDLGVDAPKVAVMHMARLMTVIILFPSVLILVLRLVQ